MMLLFDLKEMVEDYDLRKRLFKLPHHADWKLQWVSLRERDSLQLRCATGRVQPVGFQVGFRLGRVK